MRVGIAFGSNLGDRLQTLRQAREAVLALPDVNQPVLSSGVFATAPVGCENDAGEFLNAVVEFEFEGDPRQLLPQFRRIEASLGRENDHERNVSRTIDIDLLYAGEWQISEPSLQVPHPRLAGRRFVLEPLAQIRPELVLPGQSAPVSALLTGADKSGDVRLLTSEW